MRTTEQRTPDTEATTADRDGWAVPGVDKADVGKPGVSESASREADSQESDPREPDKLSRDAAELSAHPVVTAMLTCLEALESIREAGVSTLTAKEIRLMLLATVQVMAAVFALKLRLLVAGEVQRVADLTGATSTAAFLSHLTLVRREDASAEVRLAKDLDRRFPLLAEALAKGW